MTALLKLLRRWLNRRRIKAVQAKAEELHAMRMRFASIGAFGAVRAVETLIKECDQLLAELMGTPP